MSFHFPAKRFACLFAFLALLGVSPFADAQAPAPPQVDLFSPSTVAQGGSTELTLQIYNPDLSVPLSGGTITAWNMSPIVGLGTFSSYDTSTGLACSGSVTVSGSSVSLSGLTLAPANVCYIYIDLNTSTVGTFSTTFPASAFTGSTGSNAAPSNPATLQVLPPNVVTNTSDSGPGSLRDAITVSNQNCNVSGLEPTFNIPGAGPHIIKPITELPAIACDATLIDGYTQPGSSPNSNATGPNNAVIQIALDGSSCPACNGIVLAPIGPSRLAAAKGTAAPKFSIGGAGIKGFAIYSFAGDGVVVSPNYTIGLVLGNYIGTNTGGTPLGNGGNGVRFSTSYGGAVGGTSSGDYNVIAGNGANGVSVAPNGVSILGNAIFLNAGRGIDLGGVAPGIDSFPACDADTGANGLQNYPVITSAVLSAGSIVISGNLDSGDGVTYRLELFANIPSDAASNRGGRVFLGSTSAVTATPPASCSTPWSVILPFSGAAGDTITATATDPSNNTSWFSAEAVVVSAPGAPIIGGATAGNTQATVTFSPPTNNGGSPITGYTVTSNPGGLTATGTASPLTVIGLTNGTSYTFTVTATNAIGTSPASAPSNAVTPATIPGAPVIGTATPGDTQATVNFSPPTSNGGSAITSYTATSNPGGFTATGAGAPLIVTGLTNGVSYTFTVTATNGAGTGPASAASNAVTPVGAPSAPIIGTATGGNAQASVSFSPPTSNGGTAITSYTATSSPGGFTATGSASPLTVTGLTNGTSYTFTVTATNAVGTGPASAASNAVTPATVPGAPIIGTATAGSAQATVTFSPPTSNGGSAITSYTVTSNPGGFTSTGAGSPLTVTGLTNGTSYVFKVVATNSLGTGPLSAASNAVTPIAASLTVSPASLSFPAQTVLTPSAPQTVTVLNSGTSAVAIASILASGDFAFTTACPASLASLATCTISVTFTPLLTGSRTGALTISSNASGSPNVVVLAGTGQAVPFPDILVLPGVTEFGAQGIGTDSAVQIITVNSSGTAPLTLGTIDTTLADFVIKPAAVAAGRACGTTLAPGDSCDVAVAFHPTAEGIRDGQLRVANDANGSAAVRIVGRGTITTPLRQLGMVGQLDFASQAVGTTSAGQPLVITNNTASPVSITGLTASGDFLVSDACATIAAHATCSVLVSFQPTAVGARAGAITVHALADSVPYTVALSGTGTPNPLPALRLSATTLGFGNVIYGSSITQGVTLSNVGTAPLAVNSILMTGNSDFTVTTCPATLAPGTQCNLGVHFAPHALGARSGTINITTNAAGSPHHVSVSGTGCRYFSPAAARFFLTSC